MDLRKCTVSPIHGRETLGVKTLQGLSGEPYSPIFLYQPPQPQLPHLTDLDRHHSLPWQTLLSLQYPPGLPICHWTPSCLCATALSLLFLHTWALGVDPATSYHTTWKLLVSLARVQIKISEPLYQRCSFLGLSQGHQQLQPTRLSGGVRTAQQSCGEAQIQSSPCLLSQNWKNAL